MCPRAVSRSILLCVLGLLAISMANADLVASLPGKAGAASGSFTYSLPLSLPPATGGAGPSLVLHYDSQGGSTALGLGWVLGGTSSIVRCPQRLAIDGMNRPLTLDSNDRFCLDGQRLILTSTTGNYGDVGTQYRTETDKFARVTITGGGTNPITFKVETKDGQVLEYGTDRSSSAPGSILMANLAGKTSVPLTWMLARSYDC